MTRKQGDERRTWEGLVSVEEKGAALNLSSCMVGHTNPETEVTTQGRPNENSSLKVGHGGQSCSRPVVSPIKVNLYL